MITQRAANFIQEEGARMICEALKENASLIELNLKCPRVEQETVETRKR